MLQLTPEKTVRFFYWNILILVLFGLVMVYSASYLTAKEHFGFAGHYFTRQLLFFILATGLAFTLQFCDFELIVKHSFKINLFFCFLLIMTFVPGVSAPSKGAHRWLNIAGLSVQPGEFIKYTLILPAIFLFDNFTTLPIKKRLLYGAYLFLPLLLLILQPDFGGFSICILGILFVCFLSSFPRRYLISILMLAITVSFTVVMMAPYRVQRILTFLDPWKDPQGSGFQMIQSYLAFANGMIWGKGLGNSDEKLFYLPEAHNDFIFSVIGEELGLIGVFLVVLLFVSFIYWGFKLATYSKQRLIMIMMASIVFVIGLQATLNMGVVLGLLPTKGMNLPLISYGGSSMLANGFGIGIYLSAFQKKES